MNSKVLPKISRYLALNSSGNGNLSDVYLRKYVRHIGYEWGHDTIQDKEARQREIAQNRVIRWTDPESEVELKKNTFYAPVRMEREAQAMASGYDSGRFNLADWYQFIRYPWHARFTDPAYFHTVQKIKQYEKLLRSQPFIRERLIALGPDLAAAYFLCHRNCRVRFKDRDDWTQMDMKTLKMPSYVPQDYQTGWYIEEIDARNSLLIYEGINNLRNLLYIKKLDISYSCMIDAWCIDRITGEYQDTLEYLDLSGCQKLNWNGLECLWRLRKLKVLVLKDMEHIKDLDLLCLMLLEQLPDLEIRGVDYMGKAPTLLTDTKEETLLEELDKSLLLVTDGSEKQVTEKLKPAMESKADKSSNDNLSDMLNDSNINIKDRVTI